MRILITGGGGFIGSFLKEKLKRDGYIVMTIGKSPGNDIVMDLSLNQITLKENFDLVIHTASIVHNEVHATTFNSNHILKDLTITDNLLRSLVNIKFKKLIFLSSISVYGLDYGEKITINELLKPKNGYGLSKLLNERLLEAQIPNSKVLILRLPLVNGNKAKGNISKAKKAIDKGKMVLFKNNHAQKSILELTDLYRLIIEKSDNITGIHQIKSYDIEFNLFIQSLRPNSRIIFLPYWILNFSIFFANKFRFQKIIGLLSKIKFSLTIENSIQL